MRKNRIKVQNSMQLACCRIVIVMVVLIVLTGCSTSYLEEEINSRNLVRGLDKIDTVQLSEYSTSPPITVEQATQQVTEPNETRKTVKLSILQVRAATLTNNLDLKVELVSPSIAQRILDEEKAKFESKIFGFTNYQRIEAVGTGAVSKTQTSELGIEKPLPTGGEIRVGLPFDEDYSSGGLTEAAASVSYIQSLLSGAGSRINTQSIRIARHQWNITSARTKLVAIYLLARADIAYWRLYSARKELDVRREQYKLAQDQLSHAQKKVAAGSAPKIEIVRAEAGLASRLEAVINQFCRLPSCQNYFTFSWRIEQQADCLSLWLHADLGATDYPLVQLRWHRWYHLVSILLCPSGTTKVPC